MSKQFKARNIRDFSQRLDPWIQKRLSEQVVCRGTVKHLHTVRGVDFFELTDGEQSIRCFVGRDVRSPSAQMLQNDMALDVAGHVTMYAKKTLLQIEASALRSLPNLQSPTELKVLRPSELTSKIKTWIEKVADPYEFQVSGTVYNVRPFKKYTIFDLGDAESSIHCIQFHDVNGQTITKDAEITVSAKLEVYDDARLQLKVLSRGPSGEGALIRQLKAEGLWPKRAKPMPETIGKIGVVTGDATQAYRDFTTIYGREEGQAEVVLEPVRVQGEAAIPEVVRAVNRLKQKPGIDVILITRGGGDADDIAEVFDDYRVAEAICHSPIFVMTAIGHAANQTFADEVADESVASPSDAAHVLARIPAVAQAKKGWAIFR